MLSKLHDASNLTSIWDLSGRHADSAAMIRGACSCHRFGNQPTCGAHVKKNEIVAAVRASACTPQCTAHPATFASEAVSSTSESAILNLHTAVQDLFWNVRKRDGLLYVEAVYLG